MQDIPDAVLSRTALGITDCIAVALTTRDEPEVARFRELALQRGSRSEATVFGAPARRTDREWSAVVNSLAMTTAELDGGYDKTACHAALYTVPALLAESEASGLSVIEMLRAGALAYELTARIALAWAPVGNSYPPLYTHSRFGAIGAAVAGALTRHASGDELMRTLNIAATLITVGPRNHLMRGALARNVWPAAATWNGMMAAQWSACGIDGLATSVYDVYSGVLGFSAEAEKLTVDLGDDWAVMHGYVRMHACHLFCNPLVDALIEVRGKLVADGNLGAIGEITVEAHEEALHLTDSHPATSLAARFSLPHLAAATLLLGNASTAAFATNALARDDIVALRAKVRVRPFDMTQAQGHHWPSAVEVTAAGKTYRAVRLTARGGHGEPFSSNDVLEKIDALTSGPYPDFGKVMREMIALTPYRLSENCSSLIETACHG